MTSKIIHFPNLVCWEDIFEDFDMHRDKLFLDSFSCYVLGRLIGVKGSYLPGSKIANKLFYESSDLHYFLLSEEIKGIPNSHKLILSFRADFEEDDTVKKFVKSLPKNATVIIGISSPKQNKLAIMLWKLRPDLTFYCIGAAVSQTWTKRNNNFMIGTGFQWIEFLLFQPKRTSYKLIMTVWKIFEIIRYKKKLNKYKEFVQCTTPLEPDV